MSEHEPKYGAFEIMDESDASSSNVIDIKPLLEIRSNVATDVQENVSKGVYEKIIETNMRIARAFQMFEELKIDTEPLKNRINDSENIDLPVVLAHILEYLETIVRAHDLKNRGMSVVAVHPYKKMNDAALKYAEDLENPARELQFYRFYEWIKDFETGHRLVWRGR